MFLYVKISRNSPSKNCSVIGSRKRYCFSIESFITLYVALLLAIVTSAVILKFLARFTPSYGEEFAINSLSFCIPVKKVMKVELVNYTNPRIKHCTVNYHIIIKHWQTKTHIS